MKELGWGRRLEDIRDWVVVVCPERYVGFSPLISGSLPMIWGTEETNKT